MGTTAGGSDHGLFWPTHSKWLAKNRTIDYFDLKGGDTLEYKKKHRLLRVFLMDNTVKTILIDESLSVAELNGQVCEKIGEWESFDFKSC